MRAGSFQIKIFFILISTFCLSGILSSQETANTSIKNINGKNYYIHHVVKGQSLYAISKLYNVDINAILIENPDAIDGINPGQEIKIPIIKKQEQNNNNYETHLVAKGETLYRICKDHKLKEDDIFALNPEVKTNGLKEGQVIKLRLLTNKPLNKTDVSNAELNNTNNQNNIVRKPSSDLHSGASIFDTTKIFFKKDSYTVGLLLPLKTSEAELFNLDEAVINKTGFPNTTSITYDVLEGIMMAKDSLNKKGSKIKIVLYEMLGKDSNVVEKNFTDEQLKELDLIIGPLYTSSFRNIASQASRLQIPIVNPVSQQNKILFENSSASKIYPSQNSIFEGLAEWIADSLQKCNVVLVNSGVLKDQAIIKNLKGILNETIKNKLLGIDSIIEVKGISGVKTNCTNTKKNILIVPSENEVFIVDFLTQLHSFSEKEKNQIQVVGMKKWFHLDNLDVEYLNRFNVVYPSYGQVEFSHNNTKQFTELYRKKFNTDPSEYFYSSFDAGIYFLGNLQQYGTGFWRQLELYKQNGLMINFNFYRPNSSAGYENKGYQIWQYSDYTFKKVR